MADVVNKAIYGGVFKAQEQANNKTEKRGEQAQDRTEPTQSYRASPISQGEQKGASRGILWL